MASETSPLLAPGSETETDQASFLDMRSKLTLESRALKGFLKKRFWWLCILGVAAIITLQLFFLPRTSPSRDFRRWHELHFTRTDVKRIFLVQSDIGAPGPDGNTVEQNVLAWLKKLSAINSRNVPVAVTSGSSGAAEMTRFVESAMRSMGFDTSTHTYGVSGNLRSPISSSLQLIDKTSSRVLYASKLLEPNSQTPAYYLFGKNGTVRANYVFCNTGSLKDFALLESQSVSLRNRIAIFSHSNSSEISLEDKVRLAENAACAGVVVYGEKELGDTISRDYKPGSVPDRAFRLPVSYNAISPILSTLGPPSANFAGWNFGPNCTDGSLELELTSEFSSESSNATNIIGAIGGVLNDGEIVIGASRDVLTPSNPSSGHAVMLETMKRLSHLQKMGWKPLRSIRFVSWDASRSGAMGSLRSVKDSDVFAKNLPILAYVDLDGDLVTGSHFTADSNPLFNHVLKYTADLISFPRSSPYFRRLVKDSAADLQTLSEAESDSSENSEDEELRVKYDVSEAEEDSEVSFLRYWLKQDNAHINNKLGYTFSGKNSGTFQFGADAPVISFKFKPSPNYNDSRYVPESDSYTLKWATEDLDPHLDLHATLVRFLGLFVLSLSEHEVVDSRTHSYFKKVEDFVKELRDINHQTLDSWSNRTVELETLKKTSLYYDVQEAKDDWVSPVTFAEIFDQLGSLVNRAKEQGLIFDQYNQEVENLWTTDYPWYRMIRKIHIYAKFKVTNYKLLRLEKELAQPLELGGPGESLPDDGYQSHHFMYDIPQGIQTIESKKRQGAFGEFYKAFETEQMDEVMRLAAAKYDRLKVVYQKIT